jgi:hypothetical protein
MKLFTGLIFVLGISFAQECDLTPERWTMTVDAAKENDVDPHLLLAVFWVESKWCHEVEGVITTSSKGALGLGQLMPDTAEMLGVDPANETQNANGAAKYLKQQWETFRDWPLALAAYNAGPKAVERHEGIPPYPETEVYVQNVLNHYDEFKSLDSLALNEDGGNVPASAEAAPAPTAEANVIYALLPTGDQRTPYQGVYLLPQTLNGQTVYLMLEPQSVGTTLGVDNGSGETDTSEGEFDPGHITFGRAAGPSGAEDAE